MSTVRSPIRYSTWANEESRSRAVGHVAQSAVLRNGFIRVRSVEPVGAIGPCRGSAYAAPKFRCCRYVGKGGRYAHGSGVLLHGQATSRIQPVPKSNSALCDCRRDGRTQNCGTREVFSEFGELDGCASDPLGPFALAESRI